MHIATLFWFNLVRSRRWLSLLPNREGLNVELVFLRILKFELIKRGALIKHDFALLQVNFHFVQALECWQVTKLTIERIVTLIDIGLLSFKLFAFLGKHSQNHDWFDDLNKCYLATGYLTSDVWDKYGQGHLMDLDFVSWLGILFYHVMPAFFLLFRP